MNPSPARLETSPDSTEYTEKQATSAIVDVASHETFQDGSQPSELEPSDADLERAIVAAMLDGRGSVAELLADRLRERKLARAGVATLTQRATGLR